MRTTLPPAATRPTSAYAKSPIGSGRRQPIGSVAFAKTRDKPKLPCRLRVALAGASRQHSGVAFSNRPARSGRRIYGAEFWSRIVKRRSLERLFLKPGPCGAFSRPFVTSPLRIHRVFQHFQAGRCDNSSEFWNSESIYGAKFQKFEIRNLAVSLPFANSGFCCKCRP
jgi:hypothetical protein